MSLVKHLSIHLLSSIASGLILYYFGFHYLVFPGAILGGFLIDLDHIIEYIIAFGVRFDTKKFLTGQQFLKTDKIYLFFHCWELVVISGIIYFVAMSPAVKAFTAGFAISLGLHLFEDVFINQMYVRSYFLAYRITCSFTIRCLVTKHHFERHNKLKIIHNYSPHGEKK